MKNYKRLFFLLVIVSIIFSKGCSCNKNDPQPGVKDFIKKSWKITQVDQKQNGITTTLYKSDGTVTTDDYTSTLFVFSSATAYSYTDKKNTASTGTYVLDDTKTPNTLAFTSTTNPDSKGALEGGLNGLVFKIDVLTSTEFDFQYDETSVKVGDRTILVKSTVK